MAGDFESGTNEENNGDMREEGREGGGWIYLDRVQFGRRRKLGRSVDSESVIGLNYR